MNMKRGFKTISKAQYWDYFILVAHFLLAAVFFNYGYSKVTDDQFGITEAQLATPVKDLQLFPLAWHIFNHEPFKTFVGVSQIIIAIIFALEHLAGGYTWVQAFWGAGVGALLFGLATLKTGGIALPVGLHAAWNFGQWCLGFKNEPGIWQAIVEPNYETRHEQLVFLFYLLVMGIGIGSFYFYRPNPPSTTR